MLTKFVTNILKPRIKCICLVLSLVVVSLFFSLYAKQPRYALVIGNSDYYNIQDFTARNNANDMAALLKDLDFEVVRVMDSNKRELSRAIFQFSNQMYSNGGIGFFYYSGIVTHYQNNNYLIPVSANIYVRADVQFEGINIDELLSKLHHTANFYNIVLLESNQSVIFKSGERDNLGIVPISTIPPQTLVALSNEPNTPLIGSIVNRNSPFTGRLISQLSSDKKSLWDVFKEAQYATSKIASNGTIPWLQNSNVERSNSIILQNQKANKSFDIKRSKRIKYPEFMSYINNKTTQKVAVEPTVVAEVKKSSSIAGSDPKTAETIYQVIKDSQNVELLEQFVEEHAFTPQSNSVVAKIWRVVRVSDDTEKIRDFAIKYPKSFEAIEARDMVLEKIPKEPVHLVKYINDFAGTSHEEYARELLTNLAQKEFENILNLRKQPKIFQKLLISFIKRYPNIELTKVAEYQLSTIRKDVEIERLEIKRNTNYAIAGQYFVKVDKDGNYLNKDAAKWSCIYNDVNELYWQVHNEINFDQTFTLKTIDSAITLVNQRMLCGFDDWRLPTKNEMQTIMLCREGKYAKTSDEYKSCKGDYLTPTINTQYFPFATEDIYWLYAKTKGMPRLKFREFADFKKGKFAKKRKSKKAKLRLVRSAKPPTVENQ